MFQGGYVCFCPTLLLCPPRRPPHCLAHLGSCRSTCGGLRWKLPRTKATATKRGKGRASSPRAGARTGAGRDTNRAGTVLFLRRPTLFGNLSTFRIAIIVRTTPIFSDIVVRTQAATRSRHGGKRNPHFTYLLSLLHTAWLRMFRSISAGGCEGVGVIDRQIDLPLCVVWVFGVWRF